MKKKSKVNPLNLPDDAKVIYTNPRTGETTEMTMSDYKKKRGRDMTKYGCAYPAKPVEQ